MDFRIYEKDVYTGKSKWFNRSLTFGEGKVDERSISYYALMTGAIVGLIGVILAYNWLTLHTLYPVWITENWVNIIQTSILGVIVLGLAHVAYNFYFYFPKTDAGRMLHSGKKMIFTTSREPSIRLETTTTVGRLTIKYAPALRRFTFFVYFVTTVLFAYFWCVATLGSKGGYLSYGNEVWLVIVMGVILSLIMGASLAMRRIKTEEDYESLDDHLRSVHDDVFGVGDWKTNLCPTTFHEAVGVSLNDTSINKTFKPFLLETNETVYDINAYGESVIYFMRKLDPQAVEAIRAEEKQKLNDEILELEEEKDKLKTLKESKSGKKRIKTINKNIDYINKKLANEVVSVNPRTLDVSVFNTNGMLPINGIYIPEMTLCHVKNGKVIDSKAVPLGTVVNYAGQLILGGDNYNKLNEVVDEFSDKLYPKTSS